MILLLAACATDPGERVAAAPVPEMGAVALAERISLDVRGKRPTEAEIAAVEADPAALDGLTETWLHDPGFPARVRDLWSEVYLTRTESFLIAGSAYGLDDVAFQRAVGEEDLQLLGYIADHDLPYSTLVTGDFTVADETLAAVWPIDRPEGEGWLKAQYTDGRPAAGVLSTNSLWWRYPSTTSNANRKRANAISRIFLCDDYLSRPIDFDRNVNLLDGDAVQDALRENPSCQSCHNSLDPLASYLFGFWWYDYTNPLEASTYFPAREQRYRDYTGVAPAYYGVPGYSLHELGEQIAADRRFPQCAVQQTYELLLRRKIALADTTALVEHRNDFVADGLTVRALFRTVLADPRYRAGATDEAGYVPLKMATPDLLAAEIEDLTGFRWEYGGYDLLGSDAVGFRTLAGGADGYNVTSTATSPNATLLLVQERLAEAASAYVVNEAPERLFTVDFAATPEADRAAMAAQLQALHLRLYGHRVAADGEEVAAGLELWSSLYAVERDGKAAWAGVLSALLRDPDFLYY